MNRFANRVALVTAAGNGLGRGVAFRLATEGAKVVIWDREEELLSQSQKEAEGQGLKLHIQTLDMTDHTAITEAVAALAAEYGCIDVLVNNIGGSLHTPFHFLDQTDEHWQQVMDVNVTACVRTTRVVLPLMLKSGYGRVINMGSKAGRYGSLFAGANYVASKGAMQALTLQIAQEFGPHGITCNTVCPGAIMTERVKGLLAERQTPEERERILHSIPVRRHGEIEDIAAAIAYLASEEAGFVTGISLDVNGGQAMSI
jgi:NAD(P)-dependent dehydrogenase (short-subunit alcohol dehydrogenase family)